MAITTQATVGSSYSTGPYDTPPLSDTVPPTGTAKNYRSKNPEELSEEHAEEHAEELPDESSNELPEGFPLEYPNELPEDLGEKSGFHDGSDSSDSSDSSDGGDDSNSNSARDEDDDHILDNLPLPAWARTCLKKWLGPEGGNALPSSTDAFKTVRDFQKHNRTGLLGIDQMQQMVQAGYCTLSDGKIIRTPPEVRDAARKFMENDGALFRKMEAAMGSKPGGSPGPAACQEVLKGGSIGKPATPASPVHHGVCGNDFYKFVMNGALSTNRPAEYNAAKTINEFQKQYHIDLLSFKQLTMIAETGYCRPPENKVIQVSQEVREAVRKFVADDGALFKRIEAALGGNSDTPQSPTRQGLRYDDFQKYVTNGALSANSQAEHAAAKTICEFQKQYHIGLLNFKQLVQIVETGCCTLPESKTVPVPPEVQEAARKFIANDGALYKKLESTVAGDYDGLLNQPDAQEGTKDESVSRQKSDLSTHRGLCYDDFQKYVMNGVLSANNPAEYAAAKTINEFQKQYHIGLLSFKQLGQIADTGYCTLPGGKIIQVPQEVQDAARQFVASDGALFKKLESAVVGNNDGLLKKGEDGESSGNGSPSNTNDEDIQHVHGDGLPSLAAAARAIYNFQQQYNLDFLSFKQMRQIAETGRCTLPNGQTVQVQPEVQDAARKFMENDGALFKKLQAAGKDSNGGTLNKEDCQTAIKDEASGQSRRSHLSPADAAKAIYDFQKKHNIEALSFDQVKQIAESRYTLFLDRSVTVQSEARDAARMLLERDAMLWTLLESAKSGNPDDLLTPADYEAAIRKGIIGQPTPMTIYDFRNNIGLASFAQVKEIAETCQCTLPEGQVIQFLPEIQVVARKLLEKFA